MQQQKQTLEEMQRKTESRLNRDKKKCQDLVRKEKKKKAKLQRALVLQLLQHIIQ